LAVFFAAAFASASNDVASDGFYLLVLERPTIFFFWNQKYIYRLSMLTGNGLIVVIAGYLEQEYGDKQQAWSYTMIVVGLIMTLITVYNYFSTQKIEVNNAVTIVKSTSDKSLGPFCYLFQKKQIGLVLAFILLFRLGESQLLKC
jgi:PAT family beta-lactamase induction signal transducer AmpG